MNGLLFHRQHPLLATETALYAAMSRKKLQFPQIVCGINIVAGSKNLFYDFEF